MAAQDGEGVHVGEPNDGVEGAQRLDAVGFAQESFLVGEAQLDFGVGEMGRCQRVGGRVEKLHIVVFSCRTEAEIAFEIVGKPRGELYLGHVLEHVYVLVKRVFVFRFREQAFLRKASKLAHGIRSVGEP